MFAVTCPYCQTVNKRGARFCADCGAPLHLKPCPKCGKVDDVTAKKCGGCGTAFPPLDLAEYRPEAEPVGAPAPPRGATAEEAPPAAAPHVAFKPGPLIVIALVAGGLPLLWMNRAQFMPSPEGLAPPPGRLAVPVAPAPPAANVPPPIAPVPSAMQAMKIPKPERPPRSSLRANRNASLAW